MKRAERIKAAKALITELEPAFQSYQAAKSELAAAEASFDIGEKVRVTETCKRGCCDEDVFSGVVVDLRGNGTYDILSTDDGSLRTYCSRLDMKRIG